MNYTKTEGEFLSNDKKTNIHYYIFIPEKVPFAVLQICHGICEHTERYEYEGFVESMTEAGIAVCGLDFVGHGKSASSRSELGCIDDYEFLSEDISLLRNIMKKRYRSLPYIVMGQGFGSLILMDHIAKHGSDIDGALLCGNPSASSPRGLASFASSLLMKIKGGEYKSELLTKLLFGKKAVALSSENADSAYTSDKEVRYRRENDPLCRFEPSVSACRELILLLNSVSDAEWAVKLPKSLPIRVIAGGKDPIGENGEALKETYTLLDDAELTEISNKLYENSRNEIFFDSQREEAKKDLVEWIKEVSDGVVACRNYNILPFGRVNFD